VISVDSDHVHRDLELQREENRRCYQTSRYHTPEETMISFADGVNLTNKLTNLNRLRKFYKLHSLNKI
jgi:hypothetical protein